jgi:hypothetical protein
MALQGAGGIAGTELKAGLMAQLNQAKQAQGRQVQADKTQQIANSRYLDNRQRNNSGRLG